MPTVNVDQEYLFKALGRKYSTDEFRELCFEFGIELEEDTSELAMAIEQIGEAAARAQGLSDKPLYKIDIPANRYDLLSPEGIARSLKIFLGQGKPPAYTVRKPKGGKLQQIIVKKETAQIRPHVVGAILRDVTFTPEMYDSFITLQDKLHNNICRKRTLVAIGTHDLDTIQGPFTYEALPPSQINFQALNQPKALPCPELFEHYRTKDKHIGKFLHIIENSPVYPIILDAKRVVCSLPPIINGDHSKITLKTKNVFIECTATDLTKAKVVLNTMVATYSQYSATPFTVEPVEVIYPDGKKYTYPDVAPRRMEASIDYITSAIGVKLTPAEVVHHLERMSLGATLTKDQKTVLVDVPITRSDILHACDIMEDVAIAYGFNKIPKTLPAVNTVGKPFPINKLSDQIRRELALAGFSEVLPLTLCSHDENFAHLRQPDNGLAVELANPKTVEYQVVRTSLIPGVLKTLRENKSRPLPLQVFEVSDIVERDETQERRARNERRVCIAYANKKSAFEIIHGMLGRVMAMLNVPTTQYAIRESMNESFFPGRRAEIVYNGNVIGHFGIVHPEVLGHFELALPVTLLEMNLEPFL
ncbi:phenylalanine-tRNA ligase, beta subunit [Allomyces macrogynus ATCC 38327]|uniref:phenylalanine--tRNA ligase n=1 Tax=Allomyces macrogynus (strain ATCC 38327) TaxID=578462 RepID=A0A0L0SIJ8_ALLM3|nr:phenylalanine-tRNA ligase, beta subunit [Allomyces macrogynus ATCC 38327]|eukprot:KNE62341.1 phenylalanine-tRNA ligase, beta subunit [Allomyces macrogynus ATCC 38327]